MFKHTLIFFALNVLLVIGVVPGPQYPPTKGEVWPKPQNQTYSSTYYTFDPLNFTFQEIGHKCDILTDAIQRYSFKLRNIHRIITQHRIINPIGGQKNDYNNEKMNKLIINMTGPCERYPYFKMDESYTLNIGAVNQLDTNTIWAAMRGLETFSQLIYPSEDYSEMRINSTHIIDYPQYPHRGLLIDTSRHYISILNILRTLDALEMNKMNVLHWHIVDDQSFPYESKKFPDLSLRGAYHPKMVYSEETIRLIIEYARLRAIRVIPEFDIPGHTRSWGEAYPNILTKCYNSKGQETGLGPMNPIQNITYKLLQDIFQEAQGIFVDKFFHVGGDEVEMFCWESNPELIAYMKTHNIKTISDLHALFMRRVIPLLDEKSTPIVWQEVFDNNVPLSTDTIVQVWKGDATYEMISVLLAGHKVIYSSSWYLDHLNSGGNWEDFYLADPRLMVSSISNHVEVQNIVGGEACMWGEVVDDTNIISRVWPRASAVAERLWSPPLRRQHLYSKQIPAEVRSRLEEHTCRMNRRGVSAQPPNGPGFCVGRNV